MPCMIAGPCDSRHGGVLTVRLPHCSCGIPEVTVLKIRSRQEAQLSAAAWVLDADAESLRPVVHTYSS